MRHLVEKPASPRSWWPATTLACLSLALAAALAPAGCKKSAGAGGTAPQGALAPADIVASCDKHAVLSQCSDFGKGALDKGEKFLKSPCAVMHGTYAATACPAAGLVGSCAIGAHELRRFYAAGPNQYDPPRAKKECAAAEGAWLDQAASSSN